MKIIELRDPSYIKIRRLRYVDKLKNYGLTNLASLLQKDYWKYSRFFCVEDEKQFCYAVLKENIKYSTLGNFDKNLNIFEEVVKQLKMLNKQTS
jgi:hypothetical protein